MTKKRIRAKRIVAECADEFHEAVNRHARKYDFKSTGHMIIFALTKLMAEQKTPVLKEGMGRE